MKKTPKELLISDVTFSELAPVVTQELTDIFAMSANGTGSFKETRAQMLSYMQSNLTSPATTIYINSDSGDDIKGNGSENNPYATYEKARSVAVLTASVTVPCIIEPIGIFNITGNMIISPFVNMNGGTLNSAVFNVTGQLLLDANWSIVSNCNATIKDCSISAAGGASLIFTGAGGLKPFLNFDNVDFSGTSSFAGVGTGTSNDSETILFFRCISLNGSMDFDFTNLSIVMYAGTNGTNIVVRNTSAVTNNVTIIQATVIVGGNITIQTTNSGIMNVIFGTTLNLGSTFTLDGTNMTIFIDSSSYTFVPIFLNGASFSNIVLLSSCDGSSQNSFMPSNYAPVSGAWPSNSVTANLAGIDAALADGGDLKLQGAYDNGTPGAQGSINLTTDNLNPIATFNSYNGGNQENFTAVNSATSAPTLWGYGFRAVNSSSNYRDFAHIYANVEDNTAGNETGSLGFYASSFGTLTEALLIDGAAQEITSTWPMTVRNGTRTYQTTALITGNITYSANYTGAVLLSDDLADHIITIDNYFSTNGDDSFVVQTQSTNAATLTLSGGVTINGSASDFIVPINTRATVQLVNAGTKSYMVTMESVPESPVTFAAYVSTTQTGVTGAGAIYTIISDAQPQSSPDYNASTGVFTARLTGYHNFCGIANVTNLDAGMTSGFLSLNTSSFVYLLFGGNPWASQDGSGGFTLSGSCTIFLNAGDTVKLQITIGTGLGNNANLVGGNTPVFSTFSGNYIGTTSGGGNGEVNVIDDNSTNATMYPLWVTATSGAQPTYVSSNQMQWNPGEYKFTVGNIGGNNISLNAPLASGGMISWYAGPFDQVWDVGQLSIPVFSTSFGPPNWSVYDYNNSTYVLIADTIGQLGVGNPTTLYFVYPYNTFPNSTSANQLMATDGNNFVSSIPNTLGEANITDDNSTNATMYPVWVAANSGNQATKVSSTNFQWNPSTSTAKIIGDLGDYTTINGLSTTYTQNDSEGFRPTYTQFGTVASGSLFQFGVLDGSRFGCDLYDSVSGIYVFYTDPYGNIGPSTALHFQYSVIIDSASPNQLLATDGNNIVVSAGAYGTDFGGVTVSVSAGASSATMDNSQSFRFGNYGKSSGKLHFTATSTNVTLIIQPPFGTSFTATNQGSAVIDVGNNSTNRFNIGTIDSVSGQGIELNFLVDATGTYDLTFDAAYSISN